MTLTEREALALASEAWGARGPEVFRRLVESGLLPSLPSGNSFAFCKADVELYAKNCDVVQAGSYVAYDRLFDFSQTSRLLLGGSTFIDLPTSESPSVATVAIRNLVSKCAAKIEQLGPRAIDEMGYFPPARLQTDRTDLTGLVCEQLERARIVEASRSAEFATSAEYMGAKRALAPFVLEGISALADSSSSIVDLMCGSGAISGASSSFWRTFASDAQEFAQCLASVQGRGPDKREAQGLLDSIMVAAAKHADEVADTLGRLLALEDEFFHRELDHDLVSDYATFVAQVTSVADLTSDAMAREIDVRRRNHSHYPYVLFLSYFANVYFGVRQAIEIDSLRFAIDQMPPGSREWLMGALIATVSKVATTFGGHFAQPRVKNWRVVGIVELGAVLEKRAISVFHEFAVRLLNLAEEGTKKKYPVVTVGGPWHQTLINLDPVTVGQNVIVYFDPPYRRDEYSRYYHVLETLVKYNYPNALGVGRIPDKGTANRFSSEFATRSAERKITSIVQVISAILMRGWSCIWSYSDNADVPIAEVLRRLTDQFKLDVATAVTSYKHQIHGGRGRTGRKEVHEYLISMRRSE